MTATTGDEASSRPARSLSRNRDFTLLWVGGVLSDVGSFSAGLAVPLLVLAITGSPAQAGLVGTVELVVGALGQLPGGALADRWNRRRVMLACAGMRCLLIGRRRRPPRSCGRRSDPAATRFPHPDGHRHPRPRGERGHRDSAHWTGRYGGPVGCRNLPCPQRQRRPLRPARCDHTRRDPGTRHQRRHPCRHRRCSRCSSRSRPSCRPRHSHRRHARLYRGRRALRVGGYDLPRTPRACRPTGR